MGGIDAIATFHPSHLHACLVHDAVKAFGCWRQHGRAWLGRAVEAAAGLRPLPQALDEWFDELCTLRGLVAAFSVNHMAGKSQEDMRYCFVTTGCAVARMGAQGLAPWPDQIRVALPMPMAI